ncbi:MAG: PKD domain-containing protein [Bacteroidales bacterium]|nr:PKD domain-containing protein [Bacteroidales bacterium]
MNFKKQILNFTLNFIICNILITFYIFSQNCNSNVPSIVVDLSQNSDTVWISPQIIRNGQCCGVSHPNVCVQFIIYTNPNTESIVFNVHSGAIPPGSLFYQINCGPPTPVGQPICISGTGPHYLTFCKPGNNANTYSLTTIPHPTITPQVILNEGCIGTINISGLTPSTIQINSIYPGSYGQYNSYLSCQSGCVQTNVIAYSSNPPFVDYQICGYIIGNCSNTLYCDTTRVYFYSSLNVNINPNPATICFGDTSITLTATASGGLPPYSYSWSTGATSSQIQVGPGTYTVVVDDATNCPPAHNSIVVSEYPSPIIANAGPDMTICKELGKVDLHGTVYMAQGGYWFGGQGSFIPSPYSLNVTYFPTTNELTNGSVTLYLITTGNGGCAPDIDTINISFVNFQGNVISNKINPSCYNSCNGSISVQVLNGYPPFNYYWSNGMQNTNSINNLCAGNYFVTIIDALGCSTVCSFTLTQPPEINALITTQQPSCYGYSDGSASINIIGGTPPYNILWSNNTVGNTTYNLAQGNYMCTIVDFNGCTKTYSFSINQPDTISISEVINNVSCYGGNNGSIILNVSGGTPPYVYSWQPSNYFGNSIQNIPSGMFSVTVTDVKGCSKSKTFYVSQPSPININITFQNPLCYGSFTGTITATVTGGSPPYFYMWSPISSTQPSLNNIPAGIYYLTITDSYNCTKSTTITLTQPMPLQVTTNWINNVRCYGENTGSASISVQGGTPPYTYNWQPFGGNLFYATNLPAGNYVVQISDANNCLAQHTINISQPSFPLMFTLSKSDPSCYNYNDGQIMVNSYGGTPPYSYSWFPIPSNNNILSNITAGTYYVTVSDNNGCTKSESIELINPPQILANFVINQSTCGSNNGSIITNVSGGFPPYSFLWQPTNQTTQNIANIGAGNYLLKITDSHNCSAEFVASVTDIDGPTITITEIKHVKCFGGNNGSITVQVNGGTPGYQYNWYPYGGNTNIASNLSAGTFNLTVQDNNNCIATISATIYQPQAINILTNSTPVSCNGAGNGSASIIASGGTPPYTYLWMPGNMTLPTIYNLTAGTYSVTVTDYNGCTQIGFVSINEPPPMQIHLLSKHDVSCYNGNDGSISIIASGGTPPYNYLWSPTNYTSNSIFNLTSGIYSVYVTDFHNCATSATFTIQQPVQMFMYYQTFNSKCSNDSSGKIEIFCNGGTPPYYYQWSPIYSNSNILQNAYPGEYYVTVTDNNGCKLIQTINLSGNPPLNVSLLYKKNVTCYGLNDGYISIVVNGGTPPYFYQWNNGSNQSFISNLSAGTYSCTITDIYGCSVVFTENIISPSSPLNVQYTLEEPTCYNYSNGKAFIDVTGGTPPYSFLWLPGGWLSNYNDSLKAGNYTITVYDNNSCYVVINFSLSEPQPLIVNIQTLQNVKCYNEASGIIKAIPHGGTPPYSYYWNTVPQQNTEIASNIYAGTYTVTVVDSKGCSNTSTGIVTQPDSISVIFNTVSPTCYGESNGYIIANVSGGTPPYFYQWNSQNNSNSLILQNVSAGLYVLTVTDFNNCIKIDSCYITQPTEIITHVNSSSYVICPGDSVILFADAVGGTSPYIYYWSNNNFNDTNIVKPLHTTVYWAKAFDSNGCPGIADSITIFVKEFYLNNIDLQATSPICPGNPSLIFVNSIVHQFDTLYYQWSHGLGPGAGAFVIAPYEETTYYVTVHNTCNMYIIDSFTIKMKDPPLIYFVADPIQGCAPLEVSFFDSSSTMFDYINQWFWNFGDGTFSLEKNPTHVYVKPGKYYVHLQVTTNMGCTNSNVNNPLEINVFESPIAAFSTNKDTYYLPNDPVIVTNQSIGAIAYIWDFGDTTQSYVHSPIHYYQDFNDYTITLIAINSYQCADTAYKIVKVTGDLLFPNAFTPNINGPSGGKYDINDYNNYIFFPVGKGVEEFNMKIYNRWGILIFETNDFSIGWDGYYNGKICPQDVYVYKAKAKFKDGRIIEKIGDVLLIR